MAIKKSDLYSSLWASCDELRGGMDASQYKDYVLFMLFIKYITDNLVAVASQFVLPGAVARAVENDQPAFAHPGKTGRGIARARHYAAIATLQRGVGASHADHMVLILQSTAEVRRREVVGDQQDAHGLRGLR